MATEFEYFNLSNLNKIAKFLKAKLLVDSDQFGSTTFTFVIPIEVPSASLFVSLSQKEREKITKKGSTINTESAFIEG